VTPSETVALSVQPEGGGTLSFVRVGVGRADIPPSGFGVGVGGVGIPSLGLERVPPPPFI